MLLQRIREEESPPKDIKMHSKSKKKQKSKNKNKSSNSKNSSTVSVKYGMKNQSNWQRVKVYDTVVPEKQFLIDNFNVVLDEPLKIYCYHTSNTSAKFFVDSEEVAKSLISMSKRIKGSQGSLLTITAGPCKEFLLLNSEHIKVVRQVLMSRLTSENILDLSNFYKDPLFEQHDILAVLSDRHILKQVMNQVVEMCANVPTLTGLVLSQNNLSLSSIKLIMSILVPKLSLLGLNLEQNCVENIRDLLNTLSPLPLVELKLDHNPCLKDIKEELVYIKTVKTKLPQLKVLDGVSIEEFLSRSFGVSGVGSSYAEALKGSGSSAQVTDSATKLNPDLVKQFFEEFYSCLDSSNRLALLGAFKEDIQFCLTAERFGNLKESGQDVVKRFLTNFPLSKHTSQTFDLMLAERAGSEYKVTGTVLIEGVTAVLCFIHHFCIVPLNNGLACSKCIFEYK